VNILGVSAYYHDSAAALVRGGEIVAAAQEERFTRKKHDAAFPEHAIGYVLSEAGIAANDIDILAFYDKPLIKFERLLKGYLSGAPLGIRSFMLAMPMWLKQKLHLPALFEREIGYTGKVLFPEHHESHAAAAFFPSPFREAAIITFDGVGEWATTSYGIGRDNRVDLIAEIHFPHSIGLLYSAFTYYLGFRVNSGEYKVMGLAPYGEPKYVDLIRRELIDVKPDGSFRMNMKYFDYTVGLRMTGARFDRLFGQPRREPESGLTQFHMDVARSVQVVTEEVMVKIARHVRSITGMRNLVLAGGVALNCVGNGKVLREGIFDDLWIQPASGDAGGALGAALFAWHQYLGHPRTPGPRDSQKASYLGPAFADAEIKAYLDRVGAVYEEIPEGGVPARVAEVLAAEKVVGWFQGRMEFGPRALGARSILGDARSREMQKVMNLKIKFRESFRPFAPTVLADRASEWFEIDRESPYMLLVADVRKEKRLPVTPEQEAKQGLDKLYVIRSEVPAITHVDNSARLQTVFRDDHPLYYDLIEEFRKRTGCPVIINTSFNVRGEPIVCAPEHAHTCFLRTNMDYLVMGRYLLDKTKQPKVEQDENWKKEFTLD
jgi:carbamoyltransferase